MQIRINSFASILLMVYAILTIAQHSAKTPFWFKFTVM